MLTTAQIQEHFGIKITAEFIEGTLKVPADKAEKRARYWNVDKMPKIGEALAKHAVKMGSAPATAKQVDELFEKTSAPEAGVEDNSDLF